MNAVLSQFPNGESCPTVPNETTSQAEQFVSDEIEPLSALSDTPLTEATRRAAINRALRLVSTTNDLATHERALRLANQLIDGMEKQ
jgi:hypothetical protein